MASNAFILECKSSNLERGCVGAGSRGSTERQCLEKDSRILVFLVHIGVEHKTSNLQFSKFKIPALPLLDNFDKTKADIQAEIDPNLSNISEDQKYDLFAADFCWYSPYFHRFT